MKVIIADDEKLICYSLESMLEEIGIDKNDITVAYNGEDFLRKLQKVKPDVAFVDIKMPKLNGIDALKEAKDINPDTMYYILTSFPEFDYAREAINIGVSGYLLKPVSSRELYNIIEQCRENKREILKNKNNDFENKINALFNGTVSAENKEFEYLSRLKFIPIMILFDSHEDEGKKLEYQVSFCTLLREQLERLLNLDIFFAFTTMEDGNLVLMIAGENRRDFYSERFVLKEIEKTLNNQNGEGTIATAILGKYSGFKALKKELEKLKSLSVLRIVGGIGDLITAYNLSDLADNGFFIELSKEIEKLLYYYNENQLIGFKSQVIKVKRLLTDHNVDSRWLKNISRYLHFSLNSGITETEDLYRIISFLKEVENVFIEDRGKSNSLTNSGIIEKVKVYVEENYMENIGLAQIAYYLGITPNYLSSMFHRVIGETFVNYITEIRLKKAIELLSEGGLKVHEVARRVGYFSPRYFSKVFKKKYGYYPSQFGKNNDKGSIE